MADDLHAHLDRACELLWEHGHPAIAEALQREVRDIVEDRERLYRIHYPALFLVEKDEARDG